MVGVAQAAGGTVRAGARKSTTFCRPLKSKAHLDRLGRVGDRGAGAGQEGPTTGLLVGSFDYGGSSSSCGSRTLKSATGAGN